MRDAEAGVQERSIYTQYLALPTKQNRDHRALREFVLAPIHPQSLNSQENDAILGKQAHLSGGTRTAVQRDRDLVEQGHTTCKVQSRQDPPKNRQDGSRISRIHYFD